MEKLKRKDPAAAGKAPSNMEKHCQTCNNKFDV